MTHEEYIQKQTELVEKMEEITKQDEKNLQKLWVAAPGSEDEKTALASFRFYQDELVRYGHALQRVDKEKLESDLTSINATVHRLDSIANHVNEEINQLRDAKHISLKNEQEYALASARKTFIAERDYILSRAKGADTE